MHAFITNFTNNQINIMMLTRLNIYYLMMIIITIDNWYQPDFRQVLHFFNSFTTRWRKSPKPWSKSRDWVYIDIDTVLTFWEHSTHQDKAKTNFGLRSYILRSCVSLEWVEQLVEEQETRQWCWSKTCGNLYIYIVACLCCLVLVLAQVATRTWP